MHYSASALPNPSTLFNVSFNSGFDFTYLLYAIGTILSRISIIVIALLSISIAFFIANSLVSVYRGEPSERLDNSLSKIKSVFGSMSGRR